MGNSWLFVVIVGFCAVMGWLVVTKVYPRYKEWRKKK